MTNRERWTIYPLLFLALMLAARDELIPQQDVDFRRIRCQEMILNTVNNERLIHLGESQDNSGVILVYAPVPRSRKGAAPIDVAAVAADDTPTEGDQNPTSRTTTRVPANSIRTRIPIVEIGAERARGYMRVMSRDYPMLELGHHADARVSGLMGIDAGDELLRSDKDFSSKYWGQLFTWDDFAWPATRNEPAAKSASSGTPD